MTTRRYHGLPIVLDRRTAALALAVYVLLLAAGTWAGFVRGLHVAADAAVVAEARERGGAR